MSPTIILHDILLTLYRRKREKSSLEDHIATVAHYIDYVRIYKDNSMIMASKLPQFIEYLVTRSWKKMHRRIHHWSSQGFIYYLGRVDETALRDAAPAASSLLNDSPLSVKLMSMDRKNTIQKFVATTSTGMPLATTSLLTVCRDMEKMPRREGLEKEDEVSGLYNKTSCFEFHQLLVSTLLSFGKALEGYADARGKRFEDLVDRAEQVYECGTLLWVIGYSRILRNHLEVLRKKGWLYLPANSMNHLNEFLMFTNFTNTKDQVIFQPVEDEEFEKIADTAVSSGLSKSFLDWICLQVDRFQAARKITIFMKHSRTPHINLTLLAVRLPTPKPADAVMESWHETIKDLCVKSTEVEPEETICILQEKINQGKRAIDDSYDGEKEKDSIFHKFDAETYQYTAAVHCEAALASMEKFPGAVVCDDTSRDRLQV